MTTATDHVRVAIIGTGFAGLGAAIAPRARPASTTSSSSSGPATSAAPGATTPTRAAGATSRPTSTRSPSPPTPTGARPTRRSPRSSAYLRRTAERARRARRTPLRRRGARRRRGTPTAGAGGSTPPPGALTADVVVLGNGAAGRARRSPTCPASTRFTGTTFHSARVAARPRPHRRAGGGHRHRRLGHPVRPRDPARGGARSRCSSARRPGSCPTATAAITAVERALYRRLPAAQRLVRSLVYWTAGAVRVGLLRNPKSLEKVGGAWPASTSSDQVPDPELRAKLTPDYRPGCKRLLLSNDYYPALAAAQRRRGRPTRSPRSRARASSPPTGSSTRSTPSSSAPASTSPTTRWPTGSAASTAARWPSTGSETGRRPTSGTTVAGFPNLFLLAGPNTGIGHTSLVVMIESQLAYVVDALRTMDGAPVRAASRSAARVPRPGTPRSSARRAGPCGTPAAAPAGTWTRRAATPRCGPTTRCRFRPAHPPLRRRQLPLVGPTGGPLMARRVDGWSCPAPSPSSPAPAAASAGATALALAERGASVVAVDIDELAAERTAADCREAGAAIAGARRVDVADRAAMRGAGRRGARHPRPARRARQQRRRGHDRRASPTRTLDDWAWIRSINLDGVVHGCALFGPPMLERGRGHVVNVSSALGYVATVTEPAYVTTKAGVLALSQCLRADWRRDGVGVSAICPGVDRHADHHRGHPLPWRPGVVQEAAGAPSGCSGGATSREQVATAIVGRHRA